MSSALDRACWEASRLADGFEALARRFELVRTRRGSGSAVPLDPARAIADRIDACAELFDVEAEHVAVDHRDLERALDSSVPAIVTLGDPASADAPLLFLVRGRGSDVEALAPDLSAVRIPKRALIERLSIPLEAQLAPAIDGLLAQTALSPEAKARARQAMIAERVARMHVEGFWILRFQPHAKLHAQLSAAGVYGKLALFILAHAAEYVLLALAWWTIGRAALDARLDAGRLGAWLLLLVSMVPFRMLSAWASGTLTLEVGTVLKRRLLAGALRLEPEEIRLEGVGQLLGRVLESSSIESLALSGGMSTLRALVEALVAIFVLASGAGGALHAGAFVLWTGACLFAAWRYTRARARWTEVRLDMTHELIESMLGHRTRLAQEARGRWHEREDRALAGYFGESRELDARAVRLASLAPRLWLLLGMAVLAPQLTASGVDLGPAAIAVGGVLLAQRVLRRFGSGVFDLSGAYIAWKQIALLFHAAERGAASKTAMVAAAASREGAALHVQAHDLVYRYQARARPALDGVTLEISAGDRILLEGPSGGGKSTLAAVLTGLRAPESGLLLVDGLDRATLGAGGWRSRIVSAPQFHENHVFSSTLAFNLLMGRAWPPRIEDLQAAEALCAELGLGELLQRMPSGLDQIVGETGWQLSHGERSRIFIARALLQDAKLIVLDESFAALDPETLERALRCVLERAPALMVIAHP